MIPVLNGLDEQFNEPKTNGRLLHEIAPSNFMPVT
jgi:hypothetical protein